MGERSEVVLGEIPVALRLSMGSERLILFPTDRRILVARVGKRGAGSALGSSLLGRLSSGLEDLLKGSKESISKRNLSSLSPREILSSNRDNFVIGYEEVVSCDVSEKGFFTQMMLVTVQEKLEFSTRLSVDKVSKLLVGNLGPKLKVKRLV